MFQTAELEGAGLSGVIKMDESYFGGVLIRGNESEVREAKVLFMAFRSEVTWSIRRWWRVYRLKRS